jgi:hypothetical protein
LKGKNYFSPNRKAKAEQKEEAVLNHTSVSFQEKGVIEKKHNFFDEYNRKKSIDELQMNLVKLPCNA